MGVNREFVPFFKPDVDADSISSGRSAVDHPAHYNTGKIEVIAAIEDWQLGFSLGNAVKYIARAGRKDPGRTIEDLQKARFYIDREIGRLKDGQASV